MPSAFSRSRPNREPMTAAALKRALRVRVEPVDARGDGRLHRGRHADLGSADRRDVGAALPVQHTALGQFAHDLLGEKRITGGPLGDRLAQPADRGVRPEQLARSVPQSPNHSAAQGRWFAHLPPASTLPRYSGR